MSAHLKPPVGDNDHKQGPENATITLVEYGDYQCPHCGHAYPIIKAAQQAMGDDLLFVFRNFPLSDAHPDAVNAAIAAESAGLQGKYWEMHDIIYEHQSRLSPTHLVDYASKIGLDVDQFKQDAMTDGLAERVDSDFESGLRSGVNGTPSFYINGAKYEGEWDKETLIATLRQAAG